VADELDVLLDQIDNQALRSEISSHISKLRGKRTFGLVFEDHLPERVRLPDHPIRRGTQVIRRQDTAEQVFGITKVRSGVAILAADDGTESEVAVSDLVAVAEFGQPIHPGLKRLGSIDRGGDKPSHIVINAENHHALEMLQFTHAGKVDCIYIDPPYNTGARDWKYDNDYVDDDDAYRHSKWLAFMKRRLLLAKDLLNSADSVLIVTIDEKEYLRLGLLLEQTFSGSTITMVTASINNAGATRIGRFGRSAEYIFIVQFGSSAVSAVPLAAEWNPVRTSNKNKIRWNMLLRSGTNTARSVSQIRFYPIFVADSAAGPIIHSVGAPHVGDDFRSIECPAGTEAIWPMRADGSEGIWQIARETLISLMAEGFVQLGQWRGSSTTPYYLKSGEATKVRDGRFPVISRRADGSVVTDAADYQAAFIPTDIWRITAHDAGNSGSRPLASLIPGRKFPFPKSLYAVEDVLRFFIANKHDAVVLDFFAGSGTTAHAVARLNRQDGGRRQAIVVTNNEVGADEAKTMTESGLRDGDAAWESQGIFEHITRPRIEAAITGITHTGEPVKGDYKFVDEFPMSEGFKENVEFVQLTYLDPLAVELDSAFESVAMLLWMRAGGQGPVIEAQHDANDNRLPFAITDRYGVLFDPDEWRGFVEALPATATTAFIVTDSASVFSGVAAALRLDVEAVILYENYLQTFSINRAVS